MIKNTGIGGYKKTSLSFINISMKLKFHGCIFVMAGEVKEVKEFLWKCKGGMLKLMEYEICYIHTSQRKTYIHTRQRVYQIRSTLKEEERRLEELPMVRVHQGYLVHLGGVESLIRHEVIMRSGDKIPVSEKRRKFVMNEVKAYVRREGKYKKTG